MRGNGTGGDDRVDSAHDQGRKGGQDEVIRSGVHGRADEAERQQQDRCGE